MIHGNVSEFRCHQLTCVSVHLSLSVSVRLFPLCLSMLHLSFPFNHDLSTSARQVFGICILCEGLALGLD